MVLRMVRWMGGSIDRWIPAWMDGWMDGSIDRWINRSIDACMVCMHAWCQSWPSVVGVMVHVCLVANIMKVASTAQQPALPIAASTAPWTTVLTGKGCSIGSRLQRALLQALARRSSLALALRARKVNEVDGTCRLHLALGT